MPVVDAVFDIRWIMLLVRPWSECRYVNESFISALNIWNQ